MTVRRNTAGMGAFSSFRVTVASVVVAAMAMLVWSPSTLEAAGDRQMALPGNGGEPAATCVEAGPNAVVNSTVVPDDVLNGTRIEAGLNGICNSAAMPDDVLRIPVGNGLANSAVIRTGGDGICNDATASGGDDVRVIAIGQGRPFMVTIKVGANGTLETIPFGDDIATAVICAGDPILSSTPDPADLSVAHNDSLCSNLCNDLSNCIIPGNDGTLQTTLAPGDVLVPFISTGPNGVAETAKVGDDSQPVAVGTGFSSIAPGEICIDSGANGVAETSICGNGLVDEDENGPNVSGPACDDGNTLAGDGCGLTCLVETGWGCTGQPSVCAPICGDGLVRGSEPCDDGNASNRDNCLTTCQLPSCGDGFRHDQGSGPFEQCDDGNLTNGDCCSATCTTEAIETSCGNGVLQGSCGEQCDDGGVFSGDGCNATCQDEFCGDGSVNNSGSEECDDGNNRNNDGCVLGCKNARCGDGFKQASVEECDDGGVISGDGCSSTCVNESSVRCGDAVVDPPGEDCDDGNSSNRDDCTNTCKLAVCGDGHVHDKGTGTEQCDDDDITPGDGCSPTCTLECGNGVLDGACSEGSVGAPCSTSADCDTAPGNGICIGEQCDPGKSCIGGSNNGALCAAASGCPGGTCAALFCIPGPQVCSAVCLISTCGNGAVECSEQCDLGNANGVLGSGCTADCQRNLVGANEVTGSKECPGAWTLDSAPQDLRFRKQVCTDGQPCDFDGSSNGGCTFHVGVCLNRPAPAGGCIAGGIQALDLLSLKFRGICTAGNVGAKCFKNPLCDTPPGAGNGVCLVREADAEAAAAAAGITDGVRLLAPTIANVPDRCRVGLKGKVCSIADDNECDRAFGAGDGLCDIGAGVEFDPPLNAGDQVTACTPPVDVVVDAGKTLKLSSHIRRTTGPPDNDRLMLVCQP